MPEEKRESVWWEVVALGSLVTAPMESTVSHLQTVLCRHKELKNGFGSNRTESYVSMHGSRHS